MPPPSTFLSTPPFYTLPAVAGAPDTVGGIRDFYPRARGVRVLLHPLFALGSPLPPAHAGSQEIGESVPLRSGWCAQCRPWQFVCAAAPPRRDHNRRGPPPRRGPQLAECWSHASLLQWADGAY